MYELPMIKLELQHMKQAMIVALSDYQTEVSASVQAQLDDIVKNFDYEKVVTSIASEIIKTSIENYFRWGSGRKTIEDAVQFALDTVWKAVEENKP